MSLNPIHHLLRQSPRLYTRRFLLVAALLPLAGCSGGGRADIAMPRNVPRGAIAVVGAVPITVADFEHWRATISRTQAGHATAPSGSRRTVERTVSFLVRAQWLLQESRAEGVSASALQKAVARRSAQPQRGMTRFDVAFQARLDVIAEALQSRHDHGPASISAGQIAVYYATHRSQFVSPAVRDTRMVVTTDRVSALRARSALEAKQAWSGVARRWSVGSSALNGGAYAVVEGVQSAALVRAVFAARPGVLIGPVKARLAAEPSTTDYYVFEVTGSHDRSRESLGQVATEIRQKLTEETKERALAAFVAAYELRWRRMTLCARDYLVPECRNYAASKP
jgi:hypothetical protein